MSQENVEAVRTLLERWNSGDRDMRRLPEYLDPAIRLESPLSSVGGEPYQGYAGIERWMRDLDEQFAEWTISADDIRAVGEKVIAISTITARGRSSGVTLEFASASIQDFATDHRVTRIHIYLDLQEALKAVGLADGCCSYVKT